MLYLVVCNKIRRMVTTRNNDKNVVSKKTKRKIVIRRKDICNNVINKEKVNLEDCIRVLLSKKHMFSSSEVNSQSRYWIRNPEPIRCTDFERDRKEKHNDFFFVMNVIFTML